ncbi:bifunctional metallophosphatase/5'-nucleotidase [Virgibacillus sp. NKC19-16]|uniref:bifunctional metallophosphatase/5'-nucleotidase n=1 Tax=Virgibacillus salidurans TaxID=2831673 RepID=UPI001F23A1B5|nr:bifunctional UDP-sugar hydrolase/5'-nucleotidase [Virgibacillus sp. NKC19-16]UJL45253.1 bifunctional metallophosphatase/5'-nucleotidase [Virgibacillus sp. NKC19-16]
MTNKANIKILYTSDVHGNALPINYGTNEQADLGLAKYATLIKKTREINDHVIVIDNGDLIQGTPFMTHYVKKHSGKQNPMISIMNRIGIDAGVIGNHEFNFGKGILLDAIKQSNYPWLSANSLDEKTGNPYFGPPYSIKTLSNGIKAAIVGVTTHYIPNWETPEHIQGIQFADACTTLQHWVDEIRLKEKCDLLIAAYHGGFERDIETGKVTENLTGENQGYEMAEKIDGIDILLTGHQHRILTGMIRDCLIIQPGNNAENYGKVDVELQQEENGWVITSKQASVKTLEGIEADPVILKNNEELEQSTQNWLDKPIGHIEGDMTIKDPLQARMEKHPFIEFIQKVQMDISGADISVTSLFSNDSPGFSSTVTMRDIVTNYKYPNTLIVLSLTGRDIKQALERSATYFVLDPKGNLTVNPDYISPKSQHYNYDMWEGLNYTIRVSKPNGNKVENISYQGNSLDMDKTYHVVMNNYRASGGGNFDMLKNKPVVKEIQQDMVELISNYIQKHKTIKAAITNNFSVKA